MKLFSNSNELLRLLLNDEGLLALDESMIDMKVPYIDRMAPFLGKKGDRPERFVDTSCSDRLCSCVKDAIDGVRTLDMLIEEVKFIRGRLAQKIMEMRNAYMPPSCRDEINRLRDMRRDSDESDVRNVVSKILGYANGLPEEYVNVFPLEFHSRNFAGFSFGVRGKPTSAQVIIPAEVDYGTEYGIPEEIDQFSEYPLEKLESREVPEIRVIVFIGAYAVSGEYDVSVKDAVCSSCQNLDALAEKVRNVLSIDVREKLKEIRDIADVKTVEDFANWRALRSADASARSNTKEE